MMERHFFHRALQCMLALILCATLFPCDGSLLAVDRDYSSETMRYKGFPLAHISPERGKELLDRLKLGTVSRLPATNMLLVTGEPSAVQKAIAILEVVDAPGQYDIRELVPAASAGVLPSNEQIAEAVGNISIGTFARPPRGDNKAKALIDIHDGTVLAIAPIFQLQDIKLATELGPEILKQRRNGANRANGGVTNHTVQATAMTEPPAKEQTEQVNKTSSSEAADGHPKRIALPKDMQDRLRELQQSAAEVRAQRPSVVRAESGPVSVPAPKRKLASMDLSLGQSNGEVVEPNLPGGFRKVDEEPQAEPVPQGILEPGQVVPSEPNQTAESEVVPEPKAIETEAPQESELVAETKPGALSYEPAQFPNGDRTVDLMLPERLPVIQLLDLVGKYLNLDYVYDPAKITGEVTLKLNGNLRGSMKVKDLYVLLESVLKFKKLVMTRHKGSIITIVPDTEALDADPELVDPNMTAVEAGDVVVTRVFELQHIDTANAESLLTSMRLSVSVTSVPERKTLIVTAYAYRMARIEQLLRMLDKPGDPRKFRFRQLKYTMAKTLTEKVKALAEQLADVNITVAEPEVRTQTAKLPGESEAAYRTRLTRLRAAQAAAARARATRAAQVGRQPAEAKPTVYLDADDRTNRILMIGIDKQLTVVDELVDALDVEQQDLRALKLYRIMHVDAEEVSRKLQELGIISRVPETAMSSRITGTSRTPSQQAAARARTPALPTTLTPAAEVTEEGLVEEPQVVVVESTNSLLVNATAEQHAQIETIIGYVDSEMLLDEIPYKIYPLENSSPSHLAGVLESLIQETVEDKEAKIEKVIRKEEEITIVPDPNTYSLIVYANKKNQEWIANLVKQLDKRRPQVLIDVTLVEITKTDAFTYDLNLIQSFPNMVAASGLTGVITEGKSTPDILSQLESSGRDEFVDFQSDSGNFRGFYGDKHINVLLDAVQSKNYGRVLAKPKILVNDNEAGTIKTTDTTYVEKKSSVPVSTGGAGQDTTLIETAVDYTAYEAGITLDITPHISEGSLLRLDIALTRSDFLKTEDPKKPPNTTASEVTTAVTVPDGGTIILGGLLKLNQNKGGKKVPLLGDIPIVGGLFRGVNNEDKQSKLYVFVKAEIIRPAEHGLQGMEDLEEISQRNRIAFEKHETEFQNYQSWPGIKPRPVGPTKVLDAQ